MPEKGNVLVVCWDFPPNKGIGGRRWAKLAKSILKQGYKVSVISKCPEVSNTTSWISMQDYLSIRHYHIRESIWVKMLNEYEWWWSFLSVRLAQWILTIFSKGTIYDKAIGIENEFLKLASRVIRDDKIAVIFVTGAPFNLIYYCSKLKASNPQLKIVCDYRDPWIGAENYGMKHLSESRKKQELRKQNQVFENCDVISAPNRFLLEEIKRSYTGIRLSVDFIELSHAFDPDDVIEYEYSENKTTSRVRIVYAGTIYIGGEPYLNLLDNAVGELKTKRPDLSLEIDIYTNDTDCAMSLINQDCFRIRKPIGDKIFNEILHSDFVLILLADHNKNYLTSKFFEFLPYMKPYIYVGPPGFVAEKIVNEKIGFYLSSPNKLEEIIEVGVKNEIKHPKILRYSFDYVVGQFFEKIGLC